MKGLFFLKVFGLCFSVTLFAVTVANFAFNLTAKKVLINGLGQEAIIFCQQAVKKIDASLYEDLLGGDKDPIELRNQIVEELRLLQDDLGPKGVENIYTLAILDDHVFVVSDLSGDIMPLQHRDNVNVELKKKVFTSGVPDFTQTPYSDEWGTWISAYIPIRNAIGEPLSLLGLDLPLGAFPLMNEIIQQNILISLIPSLLLSLLLSFYFSKRLVRPVQQLTAGLQKVEQGEYNTHISVTTRDEIGILTKTFNSMTEGLAERERIRSVFHQAVSREVAEEMLKERLSLDGEYKDVSVLFADIRGFTSYSERTHPKEIIKMLNKYYTILVPIISSYKGIVDKFVGDEIFAVFGAPVEYSNHAISAIKAALEMRDLLNNQNRQRNKQGKEEINFGIGINTGFVVAGNIGSKGRLNYTVLGQAVNLGARLCSQAGPNQIIISKYTYMKVKDFIEVKILPPLELKGLSQPVNSFEVIGLRGENV